MGVDNTRSGANKDDEASAPGSNHGMSEAAPCCTCAVRASAVKAVREGEMQRAGNDGSASLSKAAIGVIEGAQDVNTVRC